MLKGLSDFDFSRKIYYIKNKSFDFVMCKKMRML
jgi:hypothetical protein